MDQTAKKGEQLVVIDDDAGICAIVQRHLRDAAWQVACFTNELEGLAYLASHEPDILLVDIRMPRIDGDQILEELAAGNRLAPSTRVLVSSSVLPPRAIWQSFEKFAATFISKDIVASKEEFLAVLCARRY
ncbi:MAG: response regulator [Acidobacteria bacterium]|nr:response regulator [Acidobacteriota bacterium]MDA1233609.1 response regulator [Acidobacteriota bacterium]